MQGFWSTPELHKSIWRLHMKNQWTTFGTIKGCHVPEDYCKIKVFSSLDWRNTNACLAGVLIWNKKNFRSKNFVFLQKDADLAQSMTFFINEYYDMLTGNIISVNDLTVISKKCVAFDYWVT